MRKIIQIAAAQTYIYALCDDGSLWHWSDARYAWNKVNPIPQDEDSFTEAMDGTIESGGLTNRCSFTEDCSIIIHRGTMKLLGDLNVKSITVEEEGEIDSNHYRITYKIK